MEEITGVVRLVNEPSIEALPKPKVQLIEGDNMVTNLGWWLKLKGFENQRVRITVESLPRGNS